MIRRSPVLALALALPASAFVASVSAADLIQTYELARSGDPQLSAAESGRLAQKEGAVQARATLLPQLTGDASLGRSKSKPEGGSWTDTRTARGYGLNLNQSVLAGGLGWPHRIDSGVAGLDLLAQLLRQAHSVAARFITASRIATEHLQNH